jgi:hypothetical protein
MQRVLRYVLFLETLDKHTDEVRFFQKKNKNGFGSHLFFVKSHPDKKHVQAALAKLRVIAAVVNDSVNVQDKAKRLLELHIAECPFELVSVLFCFFVSTTGLTLVQVQPFRKLVREGPISKITSIAVVEDHYVLLSDVLVYTTKWPQYLAYKGHVPLGPCWVRDLPDSKHLKNMIQLVAPSKVSFGFCVSLFVFFSNLRPFQTFTFFFPEVEQKMGWLKDLSDCIAALVQHDPTLVEQRGKVKPRHPSSNFYAVLRSVFGYSPEMIEEEKEEPQDLDEFVLIGSSDATPHGVIRVSEFADEEKQFGEFAFWRAEI